MVAAGGVIKQSKSTYDSIAIVVSSFSDNF